MTIRFENVRLTKLYPLQISRGTSTGSNNLFVFVSDGVHEGVGECAPGTGFDDSLAAFAEGQLQSLTETGAAELGPVSCWQAMSERDVDRAAMAAMDIALWDLIGKQAQMPLWRMFGLGRPTVPTSVTIGINPIEIIRARVPEILARTGGRSLKIKLGNPAGIEADKASFAAAKEASDPFNVKLRVDANGGWTPGDAIDMIGWLAEQGCDYVEQPLPAGTEADFLAVFRARKLPIFLDESIRTSADVVALADRCDGINLKLMKSGGLTEALRLVATARAFGLKAMIGCMGESSVAIAAGSAIGALFDHIDLDSHLNLNPDPATGLSMVNGVVLPSDQPGHGARLKQGDE